MDPALRPMGTAQVLDRTFHLYRNNFVLLAGIGALLPAMLLVIQLAFIPLGIPPRAGTRQTPELAVFLLLGYLCCYGVIYVLGSALAGGAAVFAVSKLHLGEKLTIAQAYKQVFSRFWRVLGVIVLVSLIVFGALFVGEVVAIIIFAIFASSLFTRGSISAGMTAGMVVGIVWGALMFAAGTFAAFLLYCKLSLAVPACILEQQSVGSALGRSWSLTKQSVGRLMLVYLLTWVVGVALALAFGMPAQLYGLFLQRKAFVVGVVLQHLGSFIAGVLASPISNIAVALIYYDQRVRKEAFDLQLMVEAVGQQQATVAAAPPIIG